MTTCQQCKEQFEITVDERSFLESIKAPEPTFCPPCRLQRRMVRRNERNLYALKCAGSGNRIISNFAPESPFPVYGREFWYSDLWDGTRYGREYDFSRSFFEQFADLAKVAPRLQMWIVNSVNSDYSSYVVDSRNCYLCFTALGGNENCAYCSYLQNSSNCVDCYLVNKCDRCYECFNCDGSYNLLFSRDSSNCRDSSFLIECIDCSDCIGCVGLRGKQYCIFNEQHSKEEYQSKKAQLQLSSRAGIAQMREKIEIFSKKFPRRYMHGRKNEDVTGDYINNSKNIRNGFMMSRSEDCAHTYFGLGLKSSQDVTVSTLGNEALYECHAIPKQNFNIKFSDVCANGSHDLEYCVNCDSSSNLFGCIGLRGKEYCILNKQYSKEEYEQLVPRIKQQMHDVPYRDKQGCEYRYGEMFPIELSPFAYNETVAYEFFPLTKEQALARGFRWKDLAEKQYKITTPAEEVPEEAADSLVNEVIGCAHAGQCSHNCTTAFKLIPDELVRYREFKIPPPTMCPNCRHYERIKVRNPLALYKRRCDCAGAATHPHGASPCPNEFETSYSPDRPEIVYCEQCYQQETA